MTSTIKLNPDAIVVMIGSIGTGKSTLVRNHFSEHHIVESDFIRSQVTGDRNDNSYDGVVFGILYATLSARARSGILTVVDSTGKRGVIDEAERIAKKYKRQLVALKLPHLKEEEITEERMKHRMSFINGYYDIVKRIDSQVIPDSFELYDIDDINDVVIDFELERDKYTLDPQFKYVVVPDLHGEYRVLGEYMERYPDENTKFVFLGDIVDRGESSYKTFRLVDGLIKAGKGFGVISNHDNKLMRYFKNWLRDDSPDKYFIGSFRDGKKDYGLSFSYGLTETVDEFFNLHMHFMEDYARDFVLYYEGLADYLYLEKNGVTHFFSHAGITRDTIRGMPVKKRQQVVLLYETTTVDNVDLVLNGSTNTHIHLGHDASEKIITEYDAGNGNRMIKHDIGFGKVDHYGYLPELYVIE